MPAGYYLITECGIVGFLIADVAFLALWLFGRIVKKPVLLNAWQLILITSHLILGAIAIWLANDTAYLILTLVCWGLILVLFAVRPRHGKSYASHDTDEEITTASSREAESQSEAKDEEQLASEQGEQAIGQEEPSEDTQI
jgi:hypothetical protein